MDEVLGFIAKDSPQAARSVLEEALEAAAGLATLSARGRIVPEIEDVSIREVFVHRHRLIYEVAGEEILILAILHGARDFARWQQGS